MLPADAFKIMIPDGGPVDLPQRGADKIPYWENGRQPLLRAFTVRHFDPERNRVEFDAMVHEGGVAMTWLNTVQPGDVLGLGGMRHEFHAGDVDRRAYAVTITTPGRRTLAKAEKTIPEFLDRTFAALTPTERDQLTALLGKLLSAN